MIFFDNVSKVYNKFSTGLKDVTLRIKPREFVSIVGTSGAGKSTFLKLLIREELPSDGKVMLDDVDVSEIPRNELHFLRRRVGMIFQDFRLLPTKTAYENVAFAMEAAGRLDRDIHEDVPQVLDLVGLGDKMESFPNQLSGGQKQRVAIARALVNRPEVILADEPTGNLDPVSTWEIIKLLQKINELGTTVILASHNREIVNAINRRVILLQNGQIASDEAQGQYVM